MDILSSNAVVTRKDHNCWGCGRKFKKGTTLTRTVSADGGYITQAYWCDECEKILNDHYEYGEEITYMDLLEFYPVDNEKNKN